MKDVTVALWATDFDLVEIAQGRDLSAKSTPFHVTDPNLDMTNAGWFLVDKITIPPSKLPSREVAIELSLKKLDEQEAEARAELESKLRFLRQVREQMLALEAPVSASADSSAKPGVADADFHDIPF